MSNKLETTEVGSSINLKACRFCLKVFSRGKMSIDSEIKIKYFKLMNEEFLDSDVMPQSCCKTCLSEIDQCILIKDKILENQNLLLKMTSFEVKQEPASEVIYSEIFVSGIDTAEVKTEEIDSEKSLEQKATNSNTIDGISSPSKPNQSDGDLKVKDSNSHRNNRSKAHQKHTCESCGKILSDRYRYKRHQARFHPRNKKDLLKFLEREKQRGVTTDMCKYCGLNVAKSYLLKHQINAHNIRSDQYYSCDICGSTRKEKYGMIAHMKNKHGAQTKWTCDICEKQYSTKQYMEEHHKNIHENKISHICELCGSQFKSKNAYAIHMRVHKEDRCYKCNKCPQAFYSNNALSRHVKNIHSESFETCKICFKVCKSLKYLKAHIEASHEKPKRVCNYDGCTEVFTTTNKLQNHLYKKHSNLKRYRCNLCQLLYKGRDGVVNHVYGAHLKLGLNCIVSDCTSKFHRRDYLRSHIKKKHKDFGPVELERLDAQARAIKMPNVKTFYTNISAAPDSEKFNNKFRYENKYKIELKDFMEKIQNKNSVE